MLSETELALKDHFEAIARSWLNKYKIKPEPISEEEVLELSEPQQRMVWTARADWVSARETINGEEIEFRQGFPVVPGFDEGFDDYYLGEVDCSGLDGSEIFQELRFICSGCEGDGEVDDDECESCFGDAEFIYELSTETGAFEA